MKTRRAVFCVLWVVLSAVWLHGDSDVIVSSNATGGGTFSGASPNVFTPTAPLANADRATIQASLNADTTVTINTASAAGGNGDLTVSDTVSKTGGAAAALSLHAIRDLLLTQQIAASAGTLGLNLTAGRNLTIAAPPTSNGGGIVLNAGTNVILSSDINAGAGTLQLQTGTLTSANGQTITASSVQVSPGAVFAFKGSINGDLTIGGAVTPGGSSIGSVSINGAFTLQGHCHN